MAEELPDWMLRAFSEPRLNRYLRATGGDATAATRLYWWNVEASAALYGPLHCLEVTLRNALHDRIGQQYGEDWWDAFPLNGNGRRLVARARRKCEDRGLRSVPADSVVAELSFGFWASLLSRGYDRSLWVPVLHRAFPHYSGRRGVLYDSLWSLVLLRNRVMHHEPVHHRDLAADHTKIYRLLGYMSPELVKEIQALDRFPSVLARRNGPDSRF
ncbi:hypothetical protein IQ279_03175 [Streptomyces verrucosisporus]|uniref:hypothetical protein n=1 Tax=Streptomyces verrucosisporus TaxID=1695161 RepID=UPI0019D20E0A|nr:hypothetical protein [Streptomyces verrucosisporus]MBN3928657.1 hypothetical protein [Streptomyces verrucosisporus]